MLGICAVEFKAWSGIETAAAGILASFMARILHFCYSILQEKQQRLELELSSRDSLVVTVETEVIRRLNVHRNMRRVIGYLIMALYYAANIYYCIKYVVIFDDNTSYSWFLAFLIGIAFEILIIETVRVYIQVEAVNYLKTGGSHQLEALCKFFVSEEFLTSLD